MRKILTLSAFLLSSTQLQAFSDTWNGAGANDLYSNTANWVGGNIPGGTDTATFDNTASLAERIVDINLNVATPGSIAQFNVTEDSYSITNNRLTFNLTGPGFTGDAAFTFINNQPFSFTGASGSAGKANITNNSSLTFNSTATSGSSAIRNSNPASNTNFSDSSTAGTSKFDVSGGFLIFNHNSQAPGACVINAAGALVRIANRTMPTTPFELGSLTGAGNVQASGSNAILSVGHKNLNDTFSGNFLDNGQVLSVTKAGTGTMVITGTGHTFTGPLSVSEGTLQWDGILPPGGAGAINIGPNGTLSGTNLLARNVNNMGGIIAPGNPANPFAKLGILDYAGTGTLCINVSPDLPLLFPAAIPGFFQSSTLIVQNMDISGTTLALKLNPGRYDNCPRYYITIPGAPIVPPIYGASLITGQFAAITGLTPRITATVETNGGLLSAGSTILTLKEVPFVEILNNNLECAEAAGNSDIISLARALDGPSTDADFNDVIGQINLFDCPQILEALNQLGTDGFNNNNNFYATEMITGLFADGFESSDTSAWTTNTPYTTAYRPGVAAKSFRSRPQKLLANLRPSSHKRSFHHAALELKDRLGVKSRDQVREHIRDNPGTGHVWVQGFGGVADAKTTFQDIGYKGKNVGVILGTDYQYNDDFRIGAAGGYSESVIDLNTKLGKARIDSPFGSLWGHYTMDAYDFDFGMTFRRNTHDKKRFIRFLPVMRTAHGKHKGYDLFPYVQAARHIAIADCVSLKPFAGVDYFYAHENAFTETGASGLNLRIKARNAALIQSKVGAGIDHHVDWCAGATRHAISVSYKTRKALGKQKTVATFIGGNTPFVSTGNKKTHHRLGVNGDFSFLWDNGASIKASYHGDFGRNQSAHMGLVSVGKSW